MEKTKHYYKPFFIMLQRWLTTVCFQLEGWRSDHCHSPTPPDVHSGHTEFPKNLCAAYWTLWSQLVEWHTLIFSDWPWRTILHQPKASQSPPPFFILLASGHVDCPSRFFTSPEDQAQMAISIQSVFYIVSIPVLIPIVLLQCSFFLLWLIASHSTLNLL
jgi:hypothetical protein